MADQELGDLPSEPVDGAQPCHIAEMLVLISGGQTPDERLTRTLILSEAALKTMTAAAYGALADASPQKALTALSGLGTSGTWVKLLRDMVKEEAVRGQRACTDDLITWLGNDSLPWLREAMEAMKSVLAEIRVPHDPPRHPTVCDLLDALVMVRNRRAHSGVVPGRSLRGAANQSGRVVRQLVAEWPCRRWTWAFRSDHAWWSLQTNRPSQIRPDPAWPPFPEDGVYVWHGGDLPLRLGDLLYAGSDPPRVYCLNSQVNPKGRAEYVDYPTNTHRRESVAPPVTQDPEWLSRRAPALLVDILGREQAVADIQRLLAKSRVVTLVGPAGLGKTTVAAAAVRALKPPLSHAILWCDCSLWPNDSERLRREVIPALKRSVPDAHTLLVLDGLEAALHSQARARVSSAIDQLCKDRPSLWVLATSLTPIDLPGEQQYSLPLLESPPQDELVPIEDLTLYPAVQLLVDRIRDFKPGYRIARADAEPIVGIIHELGGHPLALELMGPPVAQLGAAVVARDLVSAVTSTRRDTGPERQRSVRAAMSYSLSSLTSAALRVLVMVCALPSTSWSMLAAVASAEGIDSSTLDTAMHSLELRRLASREDHVVRGPHEIVRYEVRSDPALVPAVREVQATSVRIAAARYENVNARPFCACETCKVLNDQTIRWFVTQPDRLLMPAPADLLGLALSWTKRQVTEGAITAADGWADEDELDGVSILDGVVAATGLANHDDALPLRLEAAHWVISTPPADRDGEWLNRIVNLADDLRGRGQSDRSLELLRRCLDGAYESFGASTWLEADSVFESARAVFVRQIRWTHRRRWAQERARAGLRYLRWMLDCYEMPQDEWMRRMRKARAVARHAWIWAERAGDEDGQAEALLSQRILSYHLDPQPEVTRVSAMVADLGGGGKSDLSLEAAPSEQRATDRGERPESRAMVGLSLAMGTLMIRALSHTDGGLTAFGPECLESAEDAAVHKRWASAAEWIGYAERCSREPTGLPGYAERTAEVRRKVEVELGRGATTVAVAHARTASPDEILRDLGYWLPGDPGYSGY